ncbi:hypothetical protein PENTCL1PPCAC_12901, partial [Pristionchus entomophagus]
NLDDIRLVVQDVVDDLLRHRGKVVDSCSAAEAVRRRRDAQPAEGLADHDVLVAERALGNPSSGKESPSTICSAWRRTSNLVVGSRNWTRSAITSGAISSLFSASPSSFSASLRISDDSTGRS